MKRLLLALALLFLALPATAQDFNVSYNFPNAGTGGPKGQNFANTGINTWVIQWNPAAALSFCSIEVDSSSDNSTWGSGDVISTQSCTSAGSAAGSFSSSYVRINVTALSGGGLNVTLKGYHASSGGGSMTWPGGAAGIPNYSGASSWGSSYSASNTIPSNFIPTLTPSQVCLGSVTNDTQTKAAVVPNTAPSAGQILAGNAGGTAYAPVTMSGDCTILSSGAISCVKTGGTAFGTLATIATGTMTDSDYCTYSSTGPTISCNATGSGGGANTALSNLASVSINTSFLAQTGVDLGGTTNPFRNLYLFGAGTYGTTYLKLTGTPTSTRTVTFPDATDTVVELTQTQTLTNKTMSGSSNTFTNIPLSAFTNLGTTTTVLHGNAAGNPSFAVVTPSDASGNTSGSGNFCLTTSCAMTTPNLG